MSDDHTTSNLMPDRLTQALDELGARWGWFVALGIVLLVLSIIAFVHVLAATLVSVIFIGVLMLIGGIGQLIHAWRVKQLAGFLFWTASGLLYAAAGIIALVNPITGAAMLTLLLGATLIAVGALRLWIWFNNRGQRGWQWLALSGVITLATGILVAVLWPGNSIWLLGLILAIDLLFQGWSALLLGLALRQRR
ncbi:MAG TPA: HdeD family acid-resistance protein [Pusillimonas sp.]|uniref:HdeD family acid-resistance protein n=1 Tax=unclassified Pusillimonas TaxID=2640016 RepID=UPI00260FDE31|nr:MULTISPECIES: HdeD family acid-resistance protein [unclassified Pusillimonas]HLU20661.1 HdeD family acid-resistance protein [Pusillimonas sp.]